MRRSLVLAMLMLAAPAFAHAQADLVSRETLHGIADVRAATGDVAQGWVDGGSGKTGLADDRARIDVPRAAITWTPSLGFAVRGHVTVQYEPKASPKLDVNEVFVDFRAPPTGLGRASVKLGVFYPPVSLEHTGTAWTTPDMLSASAINSWIGEEVLVRGVEVTLRHDFGAHEVTAQGAAFGWNDTSGTLLSFRGWALHGLTTGLHTEWELPPLSPFMQFKQGEETYPARELDHRAGYYARLEWRPPAPVVLSAIYYDNAGNRVAVDHQLQWAWETRFFDAGLRWEPAAGTVVLAQVMNGETLMGYRQNGQIWIDVGYRAAYVLARRDLGADVLSGRLDWFQTRDRTLRDLDDNTENGWAATAAWRHRLNGNLAVIVEAQHIRSSRAYRAYAGEARLQNETALQTALRVSF